MKCEYCGKKIDAMTGLKEIQKYQKHLNKCKKYEQILMKVVTPNTICVRGPHNNMNDALQSRINSEQKYGVE